MKQSTGTTPPVHPAASEGTDDPAATLKPLDPGRVNSMDPIELRYWARQFGCTEERLMEVVEQVGEHVAAVRERLGIRH
ncbi:DUF3606 domain-containing protein [Ideonella sp. YS5]|uniref:DUF3606 domain-containing protein n=1 Tax=Ideonella sp. YS5 TaxID=3453714 RepID=UPI003EEDFD63